MNSDPDARLAHAALIDETIEESFPASDPPSWTGTTPGAPRSAGAEAATRSPAPASREKPTNSGKQGRSAGRKAPRRAVRLARIYDAPGADDGMRVLVDRLWPRGLSKAKARVDLWLKEIAPSDALRRWFGHDPARWAEFRRRYRAEIDANPEPWRRLAALCDEGTVTLLFSAHDTEHNNAVALKEFLENG